MAEDVNVEEDDIEEEEEDRGADAQQTLDDLTVLTDTTTPIDDPESQIAGDDNLEWEEPSASQSLSVIHTGSRPTDAEIMSNLVPEGESFIGSEEIAVIEEDPEAELPDVEADVPAPEPERRPDAPAERERPEQAAQPEPEPEPEVAAAQEEPQPEPEPEPEPAPEAAAAAPAAAPEVETEVLPPEEEEEEELTDTDDEFDLDVESAVGNEDEPIALDIDPDGADEIIIADVPAGATLSAGTDNGDGTWTLTADDLNGLTITPPADSDVDFTLKVTAELSVSLGDASAVGGGGMSPVSYWQLDETSGSSTLTDSVGDNDGTPVKTLKTNNETGVFDGAAEFSGGGKSYNEEYIEVAHSAELKPDNGALTLWFNADDTGGRNCLASSDSSGNDDGGHFGLWVENGQLHVRMQGDNSEGETNIYGGSVSTDEWNQVTVTWGADGAKIYLNGEMVAEDENWTRGLEGNEEPWTFGANQWSSSDGVANNMDDFFNGHMDDIAIYDQQLTGDQVADLFDNGVQEMIDAGGEVEAYEYPLNISANLTDTDGSESLSITIEGLPEGAELSAGTENEDGTWTLDSGDLDGLSVTVPDGSDDFLMTVNATSTDSNGDTRTVSETLQVDVGDDGFDVGTVGTESGDDITGTSGADEISGEGGNDDIDAGDGNDLVLGGDGDDTIDGGDGDDHIEGGDGDDVLTGGAGDDDVMGGQGDDLFIFGAGDGADYFHGGDGWSDTVQIEGVDGGPGGDSGWTMQVDEGVGYTETESGIEFDAEASGVITLDDGSELTFDGVEKLEW